MNFLIMLLAAFIASNYLYVAVAVPDEYIGVVTEVIDGDSIVVSGFGHVRMADIDCHQLPSRKGVLSKEFTDRSLLGKRVHLDIDDMGSRCPSGCRICVVYFENSDGTVNSTCFNRLLVDAGHAVVHDRENEWNPGDWWK